MYNISLGLSTLTMYVFSVSRVEGPGSSGDRYYNSSASGSGIQSGGPRSTTIIERNSDDLAAAAALVGMNGQGPLSRYVHKLHNHFEQHTCNVVSF